VHPSKSITNVLKGSSKGVIKDKHVLKSLKALARFNVASLSAGQVGEGIDMAELEWIGQECYGEDSIEWVDYDSVE
jgi:hypothetical protein